MNQKISITNISKSFQQGGTKIQVLSDISAEFISGQTYAITGESGSGKSTLLHIIGGIEEPDSGSIIINGQSIADLSPEQKTELFTSFFGLVFQQPYLLQELSVLENVMLKGLISGKPRGESMDWAMHMLETVGLAEKADAAPISLSGGQQQRVAILRALFNKPAFLLADEPTGSLDAKTGKGVIDFLLTCKQEWSMGVIVCSHDKAVVERMQYVLHLQNGKLE